MKYIVAFAGLSALISLVIADAPIVNAAVKEGVIADQYIVVYNDGIDLKDRQKHEKDIDARAKGKNKKGVSESFSITGFDGYAVEIDGDDLPVITKDSKIKYLEKVTTVQLVPAGLPKPASIDLSLNKNMTIPKRALVSAYGYDWGDVRISHRTLAASTQSTSYIYDNSAGYGTWIYVVDTGVLLNHQEIAGRAYWGANFISGSPNTDEHGHGTHVAGTAAGTYVGVAKRANLVAVKVLGKTGSGPTSGVISGLQWAANNAINAGRAGVSVINMSVGGPYSAAMNQMVTAVVNAGVTVVVAAGNDYKSAANYSPSSAASGITVAASDKNDNFATFSNWGSLVDLIAPGVDILSSYYSCTTCYYYMSGTSQATPHVAGLAAYFMAKDGVRGPGQTLARILAWVSNGYVKNVPVGTPNRLVYNGCGY